MELEWNLFRLFVDLFVLCKNFYTCKNFYIWEDYYGDIFF